MIFSTLASRAAGSVLQIRADPQPAAGKKSFFGIKNLLPPITKFLTKLDLV